MVSFEKALKKSLVLLTGEDVGLLLRAKTELTRYLSSQGLMEETESFPGQGDPSHWIAAATTLSFFADRRVVFVDNVLLADKKKLEKADWSLLSASGLLILFAGVDSTEYDKVQAFKSQVKAVIKVVEKAGGVVISTDIDPSKLGTELQAAAQAAGKKLSPRAAMVLQEMTGNASGDALNELEKLITYVGSAGEIKEADVAAIVIPSREWNVFQLVDGVTRGNPGLAMTQLHTLISTPGSLSDNAFRALFPMISRQMSLLWQAKIGIEMKVNWDRPSEDFLSKLPEKPKVTELNGYRRTPLLEVAKRVDFPQLARSFELLANADSELKGALPAFSVTESLERLVIELAETFAVKKPKLTILK